MFYFHRGAHGALPARVHVPSERRAGHRPVPRRAEGRQDRRDPDPRRPRAGAAGRDYARFLASIAEGRFVGRRCPSCTKVYVPPRGACPTCAVATIDDVPVADVGTVTTFCIVNVPYEGQTMKLPYVYAWILLDG